MEAQEHPGRHVKRVVLPNGKTIEVVYFQDGSVGAEPGVDGDHELHVCPMCDSHLVYPTAWDDVGNTHWQVDLRCPNCEWSAAGIFNQGAVEQFDGELDRGTHLLVEDLRRLARANMEEEVERFCAALDENQILPMDF